MTENGAAFKTGSANVDPSEADKFEQLAAQWWDPSGPCRPLHDLNPSRVEYIAQRAALSGAQVLDVGCGGGLLSEALAARGADVLGIDPAPAPLEVARAHADGSDLSLAYRQSTAEELAETEAGRFDVVTCLEALEHVPDPEAVIQACVRLCRPGGQLFFSTINRSPLAAVLAIGLAEHVLRLLPVGTHQYERLIRPDELAAACREAGLVVADITGVEYNPFSRTVRLGGSPRVNYLLQAQRPTQ